MKSLNNTLLLIGFAFSSGFLLKYNNFIIQYILPPVSTIGTLFLNALMMSVFPLIITSIILGMSKIGQDDYGRSLAAKVGGVFFVNSICAVLVGWLSFSFFQPFFQIQPPAIQINLATQEMSLFTDILLKFFPRNIFRALADGEMIGIIVFSMLFGVTLSSIDKSLAGSINNVLQGIFDTTLGITRLVMRALPLGIFCLVFDASVKINLEAFRSLGVFFIMVIVAIFLYSTLWLCVLYGAANIHPKKLLKAIQSALITAFSTSSSAVTLPVALDCLEDKCGINPRLTRFMIPLGITINMSGTALFVSAAALYLARAYGYPMTLNAQLSIVFISWITSFGIAGIPSGCLVALMIVLHSLGITNEAIGLIIGFDRILDMFRTICNIFANICCSVIVAYGDGQKLKIS